MKEWRLQQHGLDIEVILREVSQKETNIIWYSLYAESLKRDTNELNYRINRRTDLGWVVGRDRLGIWNWHVHTDIFKIYNQQGPTVWHVELCLVFCNNLSGKIIQKGIDTCIAASLCCTSETNTLLINYAPT